MDNVKELPIKDIDILENHRIDIGQVGLQELMLSIKQHGLKQPIGVSENGKGKFKLIFGQRRLLACEKLGWKSIVCTIDKNTTKEQDLIINLVENMQRVDPSFAELGRVVKQLEEEMNLAPGEVAARLGINYSKIMSIKKVYEGLPEKYRKRVFFMAKGKTRYKGSKDIPAGVALKIVKMKKDHGLSDKAIDGLVNHAVKKGSNKDDLDNIGILMQSGAKIDDAIKRVNEFRVFSFAFVANAEEVQQAANEAGMLNHKSFFQRIMYGEASPITKPYFLRTEQKKVIKKTPEEKKAVKTKRISSMMDILKTKVRLEEVTNGQAKAITNLNKTKIGDLTDVQIKQIEDIHSEVTSKK